MVALKGMSAQIPSENAVDAHLKAECARDGCGHNRAWHLGFPIPSHIVSDYIHSMNGGPCNYRPCRCQEFVEPAEPLSSKQGRG